MTADELKIVQIKVVFDFRLDTCDVTQQILMIDFRFLLLSILS